MISERTRKACLIGLTLVLFVLGIMIGSLMEQSEQYKLQLKNTSQPKLKLSKLPINNLTAMGFSELYLKGYHDGINQTQLLNNCTEVKP